MRLKANVKMFSIINDSLGIKAASSAAGKQFASWATSTKGAFTIAGVAVAGLIAGYKALDKQFNLTYKTALANSKEHIETVQSTQSEVDSLESKASDYKETLSSIAGEYNIDITGADTVSELIDTIHSASDVHLTLTDQAEIDKISTANSELERQIKLKKLIITSEQKEAADDAKDALKKTTESAAKKYKPAVSSGEYTKYAEEVQSSAFGAGKTDLVTAINDDLKAIAEYQKGIEEAEKILGKKKSSKKEKKNANNDIKEYQNAIDKLQEDLNQKSQEGGYLLSSLSVDGKGIEALGGYEKEFKSLKKALDDITTVDLSPAQKALKNLDNFFDGTTGSNAIRDQLKEAAENGDDLTQTLNRMGLSLDDLGIDNISQLSDYFKEAASSADDAADSVESYMSSVSDVTKATESANEDSNWSTIMSAYKSAKELQKEGKTGTDDFQEMVKFLNPKLLKQYAEQGGKYSADAFEKTFKDTIGRTDRWLNEDEGTAMNNFIEDFSSITGKNGKKLFDSHVDSDGLIDIAANFKTTAEAADACGVSVQLVETMLDALKVYGYEEPLSGIQYSTENLTQYKSALEEAKKVYDSLDEGKDKEAFKVKLDGWEEQYSKYEDDMDSLSDDVIVNIKFEYDLASLKQQINELQNEADEGGDSQTYAKLNATKKAYREKSESREGNHITDVAEYKQASDTAIALSDRLNGQTQEVKEQIQQQIGIIYDAQNAMNDAFANSGQSWEEFSQSADFSKLASTAQDAKQAVADLLGVSVDDIKIDVDVDADTSKAEDKLNGIKSEDGNTIVMNVDATTEEIQNQLNQLQSGQKLLFTAEVDGEPTGIEAIKNEDGTITYEANVDDALYYVQEIQNADGTVNYTLGEAPQEVPNTKGTADYDLGSYPTTIYDPASGTANYVGVFPTSAPTIYGTAKYTATVSVGGSAAANSAAKGISIIKNKFLSGSAHLLGSAKSNGDWSVKKSEKALVGELGTEVIVRGGKYFSVGDNGAEFVNVRKGDVIFNHKQSAELFKNGHVTSGGGRAKVVGESFVQGTAYRLKAQDNKKASSKSKKKSSTSKKSSGNSGSKSSSGNSSSSSSNSSDSSKDTENLTDWIKIFLDRTSRLTDLAEDAIDRAVGLINKMSAATDTISKVQNEISANQQAANKYLEYANQVSLSEDYKSKIRNGQLSIESISDENTRDAVSKYQEYYEAYLSASDKVLDLQDKLTDLAEKRLSIIEDEYDAITDIQSSLQDRLEADRDLLKDLGTAINSSVNINSLNEAVKSQEEVYNQLTKKLADYQAEVDSQLKSGLMKQGSEQWYDAMKNINDFTANIAKASSELIELSDKLREIKYDTLQYIIDGFSRSTDKISAYIDLLDAKNEKVPEELYQQQIDNNNASIQKQYALREEKLKEQGLYDVGSERYQELAEDISKADEEILKLEKDNEDLKDSIYELRIDNLEKAIDGYNDLEDELKDMRDLLNDDAFLDKNGGITDEGLAQIALLSQSLGNAKKTIADYTTGLQKLKELYDNGVISLDEYNDKSAEYRKGIREATSDVKSYQDSLTSLYTDALKAEVDALDELIDKRKKALEAKEDYYTFDKKIRSQQKDVDTIKAQIAALEGVKIIAPLKSI